MWYWCTDQLHNYPRGERLCDGGDGAWAPRLGDSKNVLDPVIESRIHLCWKNIDLTWGLGPLVQSVSLVPLISQGIMKWKQIFKCGIQFDFVEYHHKPFILKYSADIIKKTLADVGSLILHGGSQKVATYLPSNSRRRNDRYPMIDYRRQMSDYLLFQLFW